MSTIDQWATDNLSLFLGLDPDTLSQQVLPYLNTFNTPDDLANHLQTLLGITPATTDFIHEYTSRRFGPPPPPPAKRAPSSSSRSQFPSPAQIAQQNVAKQAWANEKNVYRKKDTEDEYFVGYARVPWLFREQETIELQTHLRQSFPRRITGYISSVLSITITTTTTTNSFCIDTVYEREPTYIGLIADLRQDDQEEEEGVGRLDGP
ncbi:hypothetical protein BC938DRAFT_473322 [Jimgerdemannia flammicorona]|uniref:Uncharacterized protein n=1 Tax=Jimgerdemannia flammicorona TaxID=994334 RepID=A0A433Q4N2_9FUNG|nr:hypothetical protein BC938DRAFT_473322 [Jimgerdemannia flammicorona]